MQRRIIETKDGSKTIQLVEWDEQYHSVHGALQEARHVFIQHFKNEIGDRKEVSVFEMGFGTGLNALLTFQAAQELNIKVHYFSLEAYPVVNEEIDLLDYAELLNDTDGVWEEMMKSAWNEDVP